MQARKRKTQDEKPRPKEQAPRSKKANNNQLGKRYFLIVVLLSVLFLGYIAIASDLKPIRIGSQAIDSLALSFSLQKPFYVVIIDAGSTGSRVLAFSFHESIVNGNLMLDNELFYETKPGLSSFVDKPKEIDNSLRILLDKAKSVIPKSEWHQTPLSMKATAGLRLLDKKKAEDILKECQKVFYESGFLISKNSISIMEGTDEGIFSWFTVNFLLDRFRAHETINTVAALDLGGGSTQVTFAPDSDSAKELSSHVYSINAFNRNMSLFTHSYLGMGLMAARKGILTYGLDTKEVIEDSKGVIEVQSECINPIIGHNWNYGKFNFLVKGPANGTHKIVKTQTYAGGDENRPVVRFSECLKIVQKYVGTMGKKPVGLNVHEIYAFSYYFDRATEVGLIDPFKGGAITLDALLKSTMEICDYPNTEQPFMCLDLTFIYVLLHEGFGLGPKAKLNLYKKIQGHEVSWALGAAFSIIQNGL